MCKGLKLYSNINMQLVSIANTHAFRIILGAFIKYMYIIVIFINYRKREAYTQSHVIIYLTSCSTCILPGELKVGALKCFIAEYLITDFVHNKLGKIGKH